ncbi:TorD/DmsD family molecular chaperone [Nitrospina watsonii]|uniref:Chaperone protein n=1 Tax=Nitrospina watsonii TaxID=1323948 RepID=A0ABM9HF51_9BACT|nr:molecular chaperone TorD family protein [Nitrospina watsonii]CAI2718863.1 putative chaperone protein [Nitrospina watsonii]
MAETKEVSKKQQDDILVKFGETGSLEEIKEQRVSLHLARGRVYDILSNAFSYPWNRKFFRPKSLLEPLDVLLLNEEDWGTAKDSVNRFGKYLPRMALKQVQQEYIRVFGHAVSQECPPYEMQYGTEGGIQSQTDVLIQLGGFYETFGFEFPKSRGKERVDHIAVELAFMGYLCFREAYGITNDHDEKKIAIIRQSVKKFLRNHLGRWTPLFSIFTSRKAERGLYKDLVDILSLFIHNECYLLDVKPIKVEEPEYRSLSYSMENDLIANAPAECEPIK